jgi:hypothetical protein
MRTQRRSRFCPFIHQCRRIVDDLRRAVECRLLALAGPIVEPVLQFKDDNAHFGDAPGAGIIWREKEVDRFLV